MAVLKVNPTRMELKNLENRLAIAQRGHHLLKEKQDSMIRMFMELQEDAKALRRQVEHQFAAVHRAYRLASGFSHDDLMKKSLSHLDYKLNVRVSLDSVYSLSVPQYRIEQEIKPPTNYSLLAIGSSMDKIADRMDDLSEKLIKLAELEKRCFMMADEIKTTRRRVNALEHRTIVDAQDTIKFIKMKIDEQERSQSARITKITR